jgi:hypothetical protein
MGIFCGLNFRFRKDQSSCKLSFDTVRSLKKLEQVPNEYQEGLFPNYEDFYYNLLFQIYSFSKILIK